MEKEQKEKKSGFQLRWYYWTVAIVVVIACIAIIISRKDRNKNDASLAPMFKKQGELTFINRENKPITTIDIEIADDDSKREIGLMGRPTMEKRQGMLFVFDQEHLASFWMRNTIISLDIIFINKMGEIVTICKNTTPFSEQSYSATALTLFVLEVNAGFTDKYGIKEGDRISRKRL